MTHAGVAPVTAVSDPPASVRGPSLGGKLRGALLAVWAGVTGAAPHVLHHVGPLAGALAIAPLLAGSERTPRPQPPGIEAPGGHAAHHR
jgi:hypothetical protein